MFLPNLIIGGTGRAGSTSLFRYLADHPEACGSSRKETQFFIRHMDGVTRQDLEEYSGFFSHCGGNHKIRFEATPHYLQLAHQVAPLIHSTLPGVKMVFILREPMSRLFTGYRNLRELESGTFGKWSFDEFVEHAIQHQNHANQNTTDPRQRAAGYMHTGCYAKYLSKYLEIFSPDDVHILFFDDLISSPHSLMTRLAGILGIDPDFYDSYSFTQENRTRAYRFHSMHQIAHRINQLTEPALNKLPAARKIIRNIYNLVNESKMKKETPSEKSLSALSNFYRPHNTSLRILLEQYGWDDGMPSWLLKDDHPSNHDEDRRIQNEG